MTTLDGAVDLARDRELVERCQSGDDTAFAELYDRYRRRLYRFCLRRLHASEDAEEAVQEAFTRAWRALPRFAGERRFYPWLSVIAANVCTDMLRRRQRVVPMDDMAVRAVDVSVAEVDIDEQLLRDADMALATEALGHLSDRHQRVLRLRESTEWSAQRIAEVEGLAVPAVDTLLWRARQAFKREFTALSDAGGFAAVLGVVLGTLRRTALRAASRLASVVPVTPRTPGAIAATVALTGAAIAGGTVALVGTGSEHRPPANATVSSAQTPGLAPPRSAPGAVPHRASGVTGAQGPAGGHRTPPPIPAGGSQAGVGTAVLVAPFSGASATGAQTPLRTLLGGIGALGSTQSAGSGTGAGPTPVVGTVVGGATTAVSGVVGSGGTLTTATGAVGTAVNGVLAPATTTPTSPSSATPPPGTGSSAVTGLVGAAHTAVTAAAHALVQPLG